MAGLMERFGIRTFPKPAPDQAKERQSAEPWREGYFDLESKELPTGEVKGAVLGIDDALANILSLSDPYLLFTPSQFFNVYKKSTAVSIPINLIAENFAQVNPVLENMETGETEQSHDLLDLIRRPHALFSKSLFLEACAKNYLIAGESPIVALGSTSKGPVMLQPINPKNLQVSVDDSTGLPLNWKITGRALNGVYVSQPLDMGRMFTNGGDRVLKVIRSYSTEDDSLLRGQSKLVPASKDVWQQLQGSDYNLSLLRQGGRASLIFKFKNVLSPEVFANRRDLILSQVSGSDNAGRVIVTHGGEIDIDEASASNKDMEYQAGMQMARNVTAQQYKVPIVLLTTDAATFNNYSTGILALWDDAIIPLGGAILGDISDWLLPRYGTDPKVWRMTFDKMQIDALRTRLLDELKKRKDIGLESIDEMRSSLPGMGNVDGGDQILVSGALTPLSVVAQKSDSSMLPELPVDATPPADPPPSPDPNKVDPATG